MQEVEEPSLLVSLFDTHYLFVKINAATKPSAVYTYESLNKSWLSSEDELHRTMIKLLQTLRALDGLLIDMINYILKYIIIKHPGQVHI